MGAETEQYADQRPDDGAGKPTEPAASGTNILRKPLIRERLDPSPGCLPTMMQAMNRYRKFEILGELPLPKSRMGGRQKVMECEKRRG